MSNPTFTYLNSFLSLSLITITIPVNGSSPISAVMNMVQPSTKINSQAIWNDINESTDVYVMPPCEEDDYNKNDIYNIGCYPQLFRGEPGSVPDTVIHDSDRVVPKRCSRIERDARADQYDSHDCQEQIN